VYQIAVPVIGNSITDIEINSLDHPMHFQASIKLVNFSFRDLRMLKSVRYHTRCGLSRGDRRARSSWSWLVISWSWSKFAAAPAEVKK